MWSKDSDTNAATRHDVVAATIEQQNQENSHG